MERSPEISRVSHVIEVDVTAEASVAVWHHTVVSCNFSASVRFFCQYIHFHWGRRMYSRVLGFIVLVA